MPNTSKVPILPSMTMDMLFDPYPTRIRIKYRNLIDLFDVAKDSLGGKIIDYNPDYRYVYFENVKEYYVHGRIDVIMPTEWECVQYNWIEKNEYIDVVPNWIYQFNKFSQIKLT